ncbi:MAG: UDP-N-acetylmuramate--L-alanine ligase [Candidatus Berkelbacteria bacterium Licking1014_85]|uniref:UDP-N-acetylmuramate--L-alanine ligase n=1 Tax=Candidatus Berkelbacteria bacterium Licking1014_85 TaxID=2017148 RepID=A0A554LHP2_9BACT|nr:MAG: UDP-N-acetylmuramate--L-alanine ligase [Candidatus Berkelbacteria bacterium Licking1014_85]
MKNIIIQAKNIFIVGIKGNGTSGLALILSDMKKKVTGSDVSQIFPTDNELNKRKINIVNFDTKHIVKTIDLVIYSAAHSGSHNPQVEKADKLGIPTLSYGEALGEISKLKTTIVICGSHGKTTTTAMLAKILEDAGEKPSWMIGCGTLRDLEYHGKWQEGKYFIVEADEFPDDVNENIRAKFLLLQPSHMIVTSIDWDHPDIYPSAKLYYNAFKKFVKLLPANANLVIFGIGQECNRLIKTAKTKKLKVHKIFPEKPWHNLVLKNTFGEHNYLNATFASRMAHELRISQKIILKSLKNFSGAQRRLEIRFKNDKFMWIDDYGHHPTEIQCAIEAIKKEFPKSRLITLFQSHTYTRSKTFAEDFAKSLKLSDVLLIAPIFGSARETETDYTDVNFFENIQKQKNDSIFVKNVKEARNWLKKNKKPNDIFLTLGAGKMNDWGEIIVETLHTCHSRESGNPEKNYIDSRLNRE